MFRVEILKFEYLNVSTVLMSTIIENEIYYTFRLCGKSLTDVGFHFIMECSAKSTPRNLMWDYSTDFLAVAQVSQLHNMDDEDIYNVLI